MFERKDFVLLSKKTFEKIIESDNLNCEDELCVYKACKSWAVKRCEEKGLDISDHVNLRNELGTITSKIRFLSMTTKCFTKYVSYDDVLTEKEKLDILRDIVLVKEDSGFERNRRNHWKSSLKDSTTTSNFKFQMVH